MGNYGVIALLAGVILAAVLVWRVSGQTRNRLQIGAATADFQNQLAPLSGELIEKATALGKPRGLRWKMVQLTGTPLFAVDERGALYALVAATISFEAIEGGGREDVEAVGNLRSATALFVLRRGAWTSDGRVIFNLEPREALTRFNAQLTEIEPPPPATA